MSTSKFPSSQSSSDRTGPQAADGERQALFVRCTFVNGHVIARIVTPSIGQRESPIITNQVTGMLDEAGSELKSLVIDFTEVGYINSMGIGMCIELRSRANMHGAKKVVLYNLQPDILHVLKMTRIDKVFTVIHKEAKLEKLLAQ